MLKLRSQADSETLRAAEHVARAAYGRLLAYLTKQWRDVATAEDALSEALVKALETWPSAGIPTQPEAWLLTVARRKLADLYRQNKRMDSLDEALLSSEPERAIEFPDVRLSLMLLCAHPAIDSSIRSALMLQTVLGMDVRSMASAFVVSPDALAKRLTRAKKKIRDAGISFEHPGAATMPDRMHDVLEAIYAAYFLGREATLVMGDNSAELSREALYLAEVVVALQPNNAEALGFLALLNFCESRCAAQISSTDEFVSLLEQNTALWDKTRIAEGHRLLSKAAALARLGPFQVEAAIHAAHCYRLHSGVTPWEEIARLYDVLASQSETVATLVGRAVAHAYATNQGARGLSLLDEIDIHVVQNYQPWWLARARLLELEGRLEPAIDSLRRAIGLARHPRMKKFLARQLALLAGHSDFKP